jgi:hypothetical protein
MNVQIFFGRKRNISFLINTMIDYHDWPYMRLWLIAVIYYIPCCEWGVRGKIGIQMMYLQSGFTNSNPIVKIVKIERWVTHICCLGKPSSQHCCRCFPCWWKWSIHALDPTVIRPPDSWTAMHAFIRMGNPQNNTMKGSWQCVCVIERERTRKFL